MSVRLQRPCLCLASYQQSILLLLVRNPGPTSKSCSDKIIFGTFHPSPQIEVQGLLIFQIICCTTWNCRSSASSPDLVIVASVFPDAEIPVGQPTLNVLDVSLPKGGKGRAGKKPFLWSGPGPRPVCLLPQNYAWWFLCVCCMEWLSAQDFCCRSRASKRWGVQQVFSPSHEAGGFSAQRSTPELWLTCSSGDDNRFCKFLAWIMA